MNISINLCNSVNSSQVRKLGMSLEDEGGGKRERKEGWKDGVTSKIPTIQRGMPLLCGLEPRPLCIMSLSIHHLPTVLVTPTMWVKARASLSTFQNGFFTHLFVFSSRIFPRTDSVQFKKKAGKPAGPARCESVSPCTLL